MSAVIREITETVSRFPKDKQNIVLQLIRMIDPDPDYLTDEDIADIEQARIEYANGAAISREEFMKSRGITDADLA